MSYSIINSDIKDLYDKYDIDTVRRTKKLKIVNCSDNNNLLCNYINLKSLTIIDCCFNTIPDNLIKLEELDIYYENEDEDYDNKIIEIPKSFVNLKKISIRDKNIKEIPNTLKNLEEIIITSSSIKSIPENLTNLKSICIYDCDNNIIIPDCYKNIFIHNGEKF